MKKGKLLYNSLVRSVLRVPFLQRESDHIGRDGAFSGSENGITVNTTVYGGKDAEKLAFYRAFNGALAAGIEPETAELSLLFPLSEIEPSVKRRMEAFQCVASAEGVRITGGHTACSDSVSSPVYTVVIAGKRWRKDGRIQQEFSAEDLEGRDLIFTKTAGAAGAFVIGNEKREMLRKRFSSAFLDGMEPVGESFSCRKEADILRAHDALLHDVSEGGALSALYELSEGFQAGFSVDMKEIPLKQETVEICEFFDLSPYSLLSTGSMLAAVRDGEAVVEELTQAGIEAAVIGQIRKGHGKILRKGEEEGFLERPDADDLMKLEIFG